ncbi:MAG TPA: trypsin-like peptidase domain-containing protein [Candidatus Saccharimonadales bacterium]
MADAADRLPADDKLDDDQVVPVATQDQAHTRAEALPHTPATVSSRRSSSAPSPDGQNRDGLRRFKLLLATFAFMTSLAAGFVGGWFGANSRGENGDFIGTATTASQQRLAASESQLISSIAKNVGPSVVSIDVISQSEPVRNDFFGTLQPSRPQEAAGTGIIISSEGLVITNRHVVQAGATDVNITLSDGTQLDDVEVVGRTSDNDSLDIAFLKIGDTEGHKLTPAQIGDSNKVQVGDTVVAIGNALGQFNNTVTSGIISGYGRSVQAGDDSGNTVENLNDLFQTDAAINQGNSGGPLVNSAGQVIGINTAVSGQGQNIGFAIPINDVNGLIKQVLKNGKFERSYLGVRYIPLTSAVAKELKLDVNNGAYIQESSDGAAPSVIPGSPADKAGLKPKDIITHVDGTKIDQGRSLTSLVGRKAVGDTVKLTVLRDGKSIKVDAVVGAAPNS